MTETLALEWLPFQAPGVIGSALGLVDPVSVYCDWVRFKVLICSFYLSVVARKIVCADPSLKYTGTLSNPPPPPKKKNPKKQPTTKNKTTKQTKQTNKQTTPPPHTHKTIKQNTTKNKQTNKKQKTNNPPPPKKKKQQQQKTQPNKPMVVLLEEADNYFDLQVYAVICYVVEHLFRF